MTDRYRLVKLKSCRSKRRLPLMGTRIELDDGEVWVLKRKRNRHQVQLAIRMCISACLLAGLVVAWYVTGQDGSQKHLARYISSNGRIVAHRGLLA
ncbi:hypothetical protein [Alicyclobacillus mengziensis]|uniref:Uncharacterized protein n=1 Tax=Alicyclobacillus mengziensis TaxID=2931921 RepID=A0A9X7Z5Q7_9BACL|nr:hypothetical protein [Alicyclobacillus mengziensis]QSO47149.1 hypothetical protein JZ786_22565 [Alicyclobacillus mengziensis]